MGLDILVLISTYNEIRYTPVINQIMRVEGLPEEKKPSACISCGKCTQICPKKIDVPVDMKDFTEAMGKLPSWTEICTQREAAQKK